MIAGLIFCASIAVSETIVVTAEREEQPLSEATAAVTVLTRRDIERHPATNLSELLTAVPGLEMFFSHPFGGTPMLTSRGFFGGGEVEYVQLLVDGVPVGDAESGIAHWQSIGTGQIDRVEVLRGPGSAFYGDTSLGGVVQVFTRRPDVAPVSAGESVLTVSAGSFGTRHASIHSSWRRDTIEITGDGGVSRTSGYRRHSSSRETRGSLSMRQTTSRALWSATAAVTTRDHEEPGAVSLDELRQSRHGGNPLFDEDRDKSERLGVSARYETSSIRTLIHASRKSSDVTRTLLLAAGLGDRADRALDSQSVGASILGTRGAFHWGFDGGRDRAESVYEKTSLEDRHSCLSQENPDETTDGPCPPQSSARRVKFALFATHDIEITSRFRIASGIRFDSIKDEGPETTRHRAWSPRVALNFHEGPFSAFAQVSRAFKAPTLDQLFDARPFPDFAGGSFTISNPRLSPQRARNIEVGASRRTPLHDFDVVLYQIDVDDEIDFDPVTFRYANIGQTKHRGLEARSSFFKTSVISPFLTYALTDVTPTNGPNAGLQLKNIPRHVVRAGMNLVLPANVSVQIAAARKSGRFLDDAHEFPLEDATIIDLRASRAFGRHRVIVDLLNVTDERYSELGFVLPDFEGGTVPYFFPAPGFALRVGFEARF